MNANIMEASRRVNKDVTLVSELKHASVKIVIFLC